MEAVILILALGAVTYFTRSIGYVIVSQFGALPARVQAALDAVPAAVITTIVIPPVIDGGAPERLAFVIALAVGLRLAMVPTIFIGLVALSLLRHFLG